MVSTRCEPSPNLSTRGEPRWRIVGPQGPSSHGSILMSRSARARSVTVTCMSATTAIIIYGHWRGRHKWSTALCAVPPPHVRVEGAPSAPQRNSRSACRVGVWGGTCFAGWAIAALPGIGRCHSFAWSERIPTRFRCLTMPSHATSACTKRCWRPVSKPQSASLGSTRISRHWCSRLTACSRKKGDCSRATGFIQPVHDEVMQGFVDGLQLGLHATYLAQDVY